MALIPELEVKGTGLFTPPAVNALDNLACVEKAMSVLAACFEPCTSCVPDGKSIKLAPRSKCQRCRGTGKRLTECGQAFVRTFKPFFTGE